MKNNLATIESLSSKKNIIIVHSYSNDEVLNPRIGGTRLIFEQIKSLRNLGCEVDVLSLEEVGSITSYLYRLERHFRQRGLANNSSADFSEKDRWWINLLLVIGGDLVSQMDVWFALQLKRRLLKYDYPALIIYQYPRGLAAFDKAMSGLQATLAVYEHNIEWLFFKNNIKEGKFSKFLIALLRRLELNALRKTDYIICSNRNDYELLMAESINPDKMIVWIPLAEKQKEYMSSCAPTSLKRTLQDKFVVGFVGTNFAPNIVSVNNIIEIAKELVDTRIVFLILGNVSASFEKEALPENIIMMGYVDNLHTYLSICDAFLNLKTTSNTGMETKMYDYLVYKKPILATSVGASGFEDNANLRIISDLINVPMLLKKMANEKQ